MATKDRKEHKKEEQNFIDGIQTARAGLSDGPREEWN
jgi:hypothetical protein